ncbi:MAG: ferredoxin [Deltaproteobacteria bacterium]|nr:MAG: ferredoxin [Deltaproteobacteria bacterium]
MKRLFDVEIDSSLCKRCSICIHICPKKVFIYANDSIKVKEENCSGCGICEIICPDLAIKIEKRKDERTDRR